MYYQSNIKHVDVNKRNGISNLIIMESLIHEAVQLLRGGKVKYGVVFAEAGDRILGTRTLG